MADCMPKGTRCYSRSGLSKLYSKAVNEAKFEFNQCHDLYRNKHVRYFGDIRSNDGIMRIYRKDAHGYPGPNGDPLSPINDWDVNKRPSGLFFHANVMNWTGEPPTTSNYGNCRLRIGVSYFITHDTNMYFADFYCAGDRTSTHYATIVLAKNGTTFNEWCKDYLSLLDKNNNPFLRQEANRWYVSCNVWIEVLHPEDIDIGQANLAQINGRLTMIQDPHATKSGEERFPQAKTADCAICDVQVQEEDIRSRTEIPCDSIAS